MKKKIVALLAAIAAVFGFGLTAGTAFADDYGPSVSYSATTATVAFPAGTFQPNEAVTVYYDDAVVSSVKAIAEVSTTVNAKADGSLTLVYTFVAGQAGKTIAVKAVGAQSGEKDASIKVPATGTPADDNSGNTLSKTGAAVTPYAVAVVLLGAAGAALLAVRKSTVRR
ncbi:hypothetical protein D2E25_1727 [Bifidobacterium goeldii]|uniref:Uncharacterized protein n=1 Tax=Bifidobacterium goeldii TaxID=2306975 RepID=A0A430FG56_9BIFI|nr:hypothetical protein [Bifidobacterium goeldii]RSX51752.1 hypothetical protein D2E25_1727 [Bifidobacterium goeldii]